MHKHTALGMVIAGLCLLMAGALAVYFGIPAWFNWQMSRPTFARKVRADARVRAAEAAIQAELQKIQAAGQPISGKDIAPPLLPDAENAAVLYAQAFKASRLIIGKETMVLREFVDSPPRSLRDQRVAAIRTILARNRQALDLAYRAARRPRCRFPVKWEEGAVMVPHLRRLRDFSRLISAQAIVFSLDGDTPRALQAVRTALALGNAPVDDPILVSQNVRYQSYRLALRALQVVLAQPRVPAAAGQPLYDQLAAIQIMAPFARAVMGDRAVAITIYEIAQSRPETLDLDLTPTQKALLPPGWTLSAARWLPLLSRRVPLRGQPYRVVSPQLLALDADLRKLGDLSSDPVAELVGLSYDDGDAATCWQNRDMAITRVGLAQTALALKAYQAQTGAYPASLAQLRRAVGWRIPPDPFSGQDFVYRLTDQAAKIYSVGPDLRDDGGAPFSRQGEAGLRVGDMVWRLPR